MSTATAEAETVSGAIGKREPEGRVSPGGQGIMAVRADQEWWNKAQIAGLQQLGIARAPQGDLAVFLHYCQKTGLDPFARQIYMIKRKQWDSDQQAMTDKWTIQTGIDGLRVVRDRAERRGGFHCEFEDTIWYDEAGKEHHVWLLASPPAGCRVVLVKVFADGARLRFPAVLRTNAYIATNRNGEPMAQWATQADHMIEKVCEAYASRRACPQDLGGVYIAEEMQGGDYQPPDAGPQRAARSRPQEPVTVSGRVGPDSAAGQAPAVDGAGPGSRDKELRRMRALFGKANMNRKADDDLRLRLTGLLAAAPGEPALWLDSSADLTDAQLAALNHNLDVTARACEQEKRDFRQALEHIASAAGDPVAGEDGTEAEEDDRGQA